MVNAGRDDYSLLTHLKMGSVYNIKAYWLILVYSIPPIKTRSRDIVYNKLRRAEFLGKSHQK